MRAATVARLPALAALAAPLAGARAQDWPTFGGDPGGMRYSPLTGIDRANVGTLRVAWTWATGEAPIPETDEGVGEPHGRVGGGHLRPELRRYRTTWSCAGTSPRVPGGPAIGGAVGDMAR